MRTGGSLCAAADALAWASNVSSSVAIVFVNKVLLDRKSGYGLQAAITLSGLHFLACASSIWIAELLGLAKRAYVPWRDVFLYALVANLSIASLNASLLVNSVGFYQVAKLLITPCVCFLDIVFYKKRLTPSEAFSILLVVAGVAVVTVTDVQISPLGLFVATVSVVSSSMQQILCGAMQRKHQLSSHQLLSSTAYIQGTMLLLVGPYIDQALSQRWILDYKWTAVALQQLAISCALALLVNLSQFMCLGRFSAVTFQVLGHSKTVLVLLTSWIILQEQMTSRKLLGIALAVVGIVAYGLLGTRRTKAAADESLRPSYAAVAVTAEVSLSRAPYKDARATGLLASYPITVSEDDGGVASFSQKPFDGGAKVAMMTNDESIAASVKRRRRGGKVA